MDTENTPRSKASQDIPPAKVLVGLPVNLLCLAEDVREFMGISAETWKLWVAAGLETYKPGTKAGYVFTGDVHEFFRSRLPLGVRQSVVRKQKLAEKRRKRKK